MLTGVILAKNEQENIKKCIESLRFCDQVIVVDDESTDATVNSAKKVKAKVVTRALNGDYSAQRNWAIEQVKSGWILFVDADEEVSTKLATEITSQIQKIEYKGFMIPRVDFIWGRELHHGDVGNVKILRLARKGAGKWQGRVHETWNIEGRVGVLKNPLLHRPHPTMAAFLKHINRYSTIRARELYKGEIKTNIGQISLYPFAKFLYLYFWKLGFLDSTAGFVHAMTMAFYTFLTRGKLWLLYKGIDEDK